MNEVLYKLCRHCVGVMDGWHPYPSTALSKNCGLSLYRTRKELKKLKEQGLVVSDMEFLSDEDGNYIIRGYTITEKAKQTEEYLKAWEEEKMLCAVVFGFDIGEKQ
ncbi:hypothetical protein [uncultured Dubosiella sp.]|uniref:hypothetical protein n=1 Tax=uncultured Dubosiella sp. TaxID=1937011 RepID=UPI00272DDA01|nr:hypothetical protein [uncultured Dubosiella sp.]